MAKNFQTAQDIVARLRAADASELAVLEHTVQADTRKTVQQALSSARKRVAAQEAEYERVSAMYRFQCEYAPCEQVVGLDEVGRGPLAGPLTVAAVVLPEEPVLVGINDSKQVAPAMREELAAKIKSIALFYAIEHIPPDDIENHGMTTCLKHAFSNALRSVEAQGASPAVVLLDGNPLHFDTRERNVIKGDAKVASIAAASIIAKVERDAMMNEYARDYPEYGFDRNKGYGSEEHRNAIARYGLTPLHRRSFCTSFVQDTLF